MANSSLRQTGRFLSQTSLLRQQKVALSLSIVSKEKKNEEGRQNGNSNRSWGAAVGLGVIGAGLVFVAPLAAEEKNEKKIRGRTQHDRIRQFATADNVYDHFAGYQLVAESGKKTNLMSTRHFYNAMTPGSNLGGDLALGKSAYQQIELSEIDSAYIKNQNRLPVDGSNVLNQINEHGLLTYTDYHFLLLLMSTPTRYLDIIFHGFDVSADGSVEAKEFVHVLTRIANIKTDPEEQMKTANISGLVRFLFGDDLSGSLTKKDFVNLQNDLISDVLAMEFTRYVGDLSEKMSETDFCRHLLYSSQIPQKRKEKMIKQVSDEYKKRGSKGIGFKSFKDFYCVLFGGADLERAMFFLNTEKQGVTKDEFAKIANWVVGTDIDPEVIEVIYFLLDEDGDQHLSTVEFSPVLFNWRNSRGFQKGALNVTLGSMTF